MAGKKKQPPRPPQPPQSKPGQPGPVKPSGPTPSQAKTVAPDAPVAPIRPQAPPAEAAAADPRPAAPAAPITPVSAVPAQVAAPGHANDPGRDPARGHSKLLTQQKAAPKGQVPLLGIDWDELPTINIQRLPYWTMPIIYALVVFSFILLAMAYVARSTTHTVNRISIVPDMDNEPRWKTQQANYMFSDHRASRAWPDGTVARGMLNNDDHYNRGIVAGQWATALPPQVTVDQALLNRGQQRFNIYCSPCHGESGYGDGMVSKHADNLKEGTWTQPLNYHTDQVRGRPVGHLFNTITNGIRTMPPYGSQIPVADRWAIVAWIRVLQASQDVDVDTVSPERQQKLLESKPKVDAAPAAPAASAPTTATNQAVSTTKTTPPSAGDVTGGNQSNPTTPGMTPPPAPVPAPGAPTTPPSNTTTPPQGSTK